MQKVFAAAGLVAVAFLAFGEHSLRTFSAPAPSAAAMTLNKHEHAAAYGDASSAASPFAMRMPEPQYAAQPAAQSRWSLSDAALLAGVGALVGSAVAYRSRSRVSQERLLAVAEPDVELAVQVATLAVGGQEAAPMAGPSAAKDDLVALAKDLNPVIGYWDPLNLAEANFWDQGNEATIGFLRHAEIKHGRVAMAAFVGYLVHANGIHFPWKMPGDELAGPGCDPVALWAGLPRLAKTQIILVLGWFEYYGEAGLTENPNLKHYMRGGKPGVYPSFKEEPFPAPHPVPFSLFDPFGLQKGKSAEWKAERLKIELNNGRLAMIGIMAFLSEGAIPGSVPVLNGMGVIKPTGVINVMDPFNFKTCVETCIPPDVLG